MKLKINLLISSILLLTACKPKINYKNEWTNIFNGKDLEGWSVLSNDVETSKSFWKIENGVIHNITSGNKNHPGSWLAFNEELSDFEFKIKFKSKGELKGNSGVQFRSTLDLPNNKMQGLQIDIHPIGPYRTGLLYDETDGVKHWLFPVTETWRLDSYEHNKNWKYNQDDWNELYLKCEGTKIITKLNGIEIVNYNGEGVINNNLHKNMGVGMKGTLSIQLHRKHDIDIYFKDLQLKRL
jgi:hypothetical protein